MDYKPDEVEDLIKIAMDCGIAKNPDLFKMILDRVYPNTAESVSGVVEKYMGVLMQFLQQAQEKETGGKSE